MNEIFQYFYECFVLWNHPNFYIFYSFLDSGMAMSITLNREEAQQVLDALEHDGLLKKKQMIKTLRAKLNPKDYVVIIDKFVPMEPEPVLWMASNGMVSRECIGHFKQPLYTALPRHELKPACWLYKGEVRLSPSDLPPEETIPLYTTQPQREWQGLTDEEVQSEVARVLATLTQDIWPIALSRAIEAKLREKNT
jgi:hypothetical protein